MRMMSAPRFWHPDNPAGFAARLLPLLLWPLSLVWRLGGLIRRWRAKPYRAAVPVVCVGNAVLGGSGKTPFALFLADLLAQAGEKPVILTRGYGGALSGPLRVDPQRHSAAETGDEALALAQYQLVCLAKDRAAGARLCQTLGASVIIMDDGLQNFALAQDITFLLARAESFANQHIFPAGPWRETYAAAAARAHALVWPRGEKPVLPAGFDRPVFLLIRRPAKKPPPTRPVIAYAGIARPEQFFAVLRQERYDLASVFPFADHHCFTAAEAARLLAEAKRLDAALITTEKDYARLAASPHRQHRQLAAASEVYPLRLAVEEEEKFRHFVLTSLARTRAVLAG